MEVAVCCGSLDGSLPKLPVRPGAAIRVLPTVAACMEPKRSMYRCWTPDVPGVWHPQVHAPCAHNEFVGLCRRTLGPVPRIREAGLAGFRKAMCELRRVISGRVGAVDPWPIDRVVKSYQVPRLRKRYEEAARSLDADGLCGPEDARVTAFVKAEKLSQYKVSKPRMIMGRRPRYNLELASFLKPIEEALYPAFRGWGKRFFTHTRLIGKGLAMGERASLIRRKMQSRPGVVAVELDCKSFESHVCSATLAEEHRVYTDLCRDPRLRKLLSWQHTCKGEGLSGSVRFRVKGVRASGDYNTGCGNTLQMCGLVLFVAQSLGRPFDFLADGDNAVLFVQDHELDIWISALPELFLECGHEVTIGEPAREIETVVFGQAKPCRVAGGWTMVRDPFKTIAHAFSGHRHYSDMRYGVKILRAVAYCEAVVNRGVPVLQEFAHAMLRGTRGVSYPKTPDLENYEYQRIVARDDGWQQKNWDPISDDARLSFAMSWGIPLEEQIRLENYFRTVVVELPRTFDNVERSWAWMDSSAWLDEDVLGAVRVWRMH